MKFILFSFLFLSFSLNITLSAKAFGYNKDAKFANMLWKQMSKMRIVGANHIATHPYKGLPPHGTYMEMLEVKITVGRTRGYAIVQKNYAGNHIGIMNIINNPMKHLSNVSVMFKRKNGYDSENKDWFYVQYDARGVVMKSSKGNRLAGRIDRDSNRGCIACHRTAPGNDFVFSHDKLSKLPTNRLYKIKQKKIKLVRPQPMQKPKEKQKEMMHKKKDMAMEQKADMAMMKETTMMQEDAKMTTPAYKKQSMMKK